MPFSIQVPTLKLNHFQDEFQNDYRLINHQIDGRNTILKPHKHEFYLFFLIENGAGIHTIDHKKFEVKNNQLHILLPDQSHKWELAPETTGYQFMINQEILHSLADLTHLNLIRSQQLQVINLQAQYFNALLQEFKALEAELLSKKDNNWRIIYTRSQLITLLIDQEIKRYYQVEVAEKIPNLLVNYQSLINKNFITQKQVSYYAQRLHITPNYLNILCKKHFNSTALSLIQNRIIQEAKTMLLYSNLSVKEIAYTLGFKDVSYFSNFFRGQIGTSPRSFKE